MFEKAVENLQKGGKNAQKNALPANENRQTRRLAGGV
jgi:hypothetical protein